MNSFFSYPYFKVDPLNSFVAMAIGLFFGVTVLYSLKFMKGRKGLLQYYTYILLTGLASIGVVFANNLAVLVACWGFLALTLYLLINMGDEDAPAVAKKALIIVGGSDALMIIGLGIVYSFTQSLQMDIARLELNNYLAVCAYICLAIACFAKAGAMPMHTWIPDCAKSAPIPVTAYLPASLDKLLGIYLLSRISLSMFVMNNAMNNLLMCVGAFTILAAVMMALTQHNLKRLLGYHAVSQVGYMVLGIGTGNAIGIAGGIFHMLNHALYKSCLFFTAGNVEYRAKSSELDELGGLAKYMPITFLACLVASFSISGVPPFNGFVSKWFIYQGLIVRLREGGSFLQQGFGVLCLIAAMFGSGLTLASFIKLLHAVFLGERLSGAKVKNIQEVPLGMWLPVGLLALICILFGVFAFQLPLKYFIFPAVSGYLPITADTLPGIWSPTFATMLICIAFILGGVIFAFTKAKLPLRKDTTFTGGEPVDQPVETMVTGVDFYKTIQDMPWVGRMYALAQKGTFDIYVQARKLLFFSRFLQYLHNGVLPTYLVWFLLGVGVLFLVLAR